MALDQLMLAELTDSEGAQKQLGARFGRPVSHDSVRQYVKQGKLRALQFEDGILIVRAPSEDTRGRDLLFLRCDLDALPVPPRPGRPKK